MVEIKKIEIKVGEKTIDLTEDEARALKVKLDGLFGAAYRYIPYPSYPNLYYVTS